MSTEQARVHRGVPTGGEFVKTVHDEAGIALPTPAPANDLLYDADGTEWDWDPDKEATLVSEYRNGVGMRIKLHRDGTATYQVIDQHNGKVLTEGYTEDSDAKDEAKAHRDRLAKYAGTGPLKVGARTPWGSAHAATSLAPGIDVVHTAGHGGVKLSAARNREVDPAWRRPGGWFEEDIDWSIAAISHPDGFTQEQVKAAHECARRWLPEKYMQVVGTDPAKYGITDYQPIQPGESHVWDEKVFFRANHENVERALSAVGLPDGLVKVSLATVDAAGNATPASERRTVLMTREEYDGVRTAGQQMTVPKGAYFPSA